MRVKGKVIFKKSSAWKTQVSQCLGFPRLKRKQEEEEKITSIAVFSTRVS